MAAQSGWSMTDIAFKYRVSRPTIYNYRRKLVSLGYDILDTSRTQEQADEAAQALIDADKPKAAYTGLAHEAHDFIGKPTRDISGRLPHTVTHQERLDAQARLKLLAKIAQDQNIPPSQLISAIKTLDDLEQRNRPPETYGPPAPLTEEEVVQRLTRLMKAQGREATLKAVSLCEEHQWTDSFSLNGKTPTTNQAQKETQTTSSETPSPASSSPQDGSSDSVKKMESNPSTSPTTSPQLMTKAHYEATTESPGPSSDASGRSPERN
jgi:hypothetical protein